MTDNHLMLRMTLLQHDCGAGIAPEPVRRHDWDINATNAGTIS
jgi:hypothetical protein